MEIVFGKCTYIFSTLYIISHRFLYKKSIFHVGKIFGYVFSIKRFIPYTFECIPYFFFTKKKSQSIMEVM